MPNIDENEDVIKENLEKELIIYINMSIDAGNAKRDLQIRLENIYIQYQNSQKRTFES